MISGNAFSCVVGVVGALGESETPRARPNVRLERAARMTRWCEVALRLARDLRHVLGGRTLLSLHDLELDEVTLGERLEAVPLDRRVMNETILLSILRRDEAKPL